MDKETEIFKRIWHWGIETNYEISQYGNVFSYAKGKRKPIKLSKDIAGYLSFDLKNKGNRYHCLAHIKVGENFIDNPLNLPEINHLDGDKSNIFYKNLEWSTRQNNIIHAIRLGLIKYKTGVEHHNSRRIGKFKNGELIQEYNQVILAAKEGHRQGLISSCLTQKRKTHHGYNWQYLD